MTTAAMIFGMLPLALGLGESGETQAPMGRAIIGGVHHLDAAHARRRAGDLHLSRPLHRMAPRAERAAARARASPAQTRLLPAIDVR